MEGSPALPASGGPAEPPADRAPRADPLAAWVFGALVVACFAAFAITQHLKHTPTVVQSFKRTPFFFPDAKGPRRYEHLSFRISHADEVTVTVLDSSEREIATLLRDYPLARYTQLSFEWDGHRGPTAPPRPAAGTPHDPLVPRDRGALASAGEYHLRVSLRRQNRSVLSPHGFTLSLTAPGGAG